MAYAHDTSAFAVQTIRRWWQDIGCKRHPVAKRLTITCDGRRSNVSRVPLWKLGMQSWSRASEEDPT